jgi:hypothetical protein
MTFGFPIVPPFFFEQASRGAINVHPLGPAGLSRCTAS